MRTCICLDFFVTRSMVDDNHSRTSCCLNDFHFVLTLEANNSWQTLKCLSIQVHVCLSLYNLFMFIRTQQINTSVNFHGKQPEHGEAAVFAGCVNNGSNCISPRISDQSSAIHSDSLHNDNN